MELHLDDMPQLGVPYTGLVQVSIYDDTQNSHVLRSSIEGRSMFFSGKLEPHQTVVLLVSARVVSVTKVPCLVAAEETQVFPKPCIRLQNLFNVAEVCSGMGCLGVGLQSAGFEVKVRSDINPNMLQLATKIGNGEILLGDVCSDSLLADLSRYHGDAQTIAAGVACQPYSRLGDKRQQHDPRSSTLPGVLRLGFLGGFGMIVLECVQEAHTCSWIQQLLHKFSASTGYKVTQGILSLQHVWVARRTRWWCILTHPSLGQVPWEPMPKLNPPPIIADLVDRFQSCDKELLEQLKLDLYELGRFDAQGFHQNEVSWQGQMATSLHSCGNQLMGCPCGCRKYAFTDQRLQQGGLHGLLILLDGTSKCGQKIYPNHRHISPDELALFNGMFPGIQWGVHPKMTLCALGQMASPIQACWVGAIAMQHINQHFSLSEGPHPNECLLKLMHQLLQARDGVFGIQQGPNSQAFKSKIEQGILVQKEEELMPPSTPPNVLPSQSLPLPPPTEVNRQNMNQPVTGQQGVSAQAQTPVIGPADCSAPSVPPVPLSTVVTPVGSSSSHENVPGMFSVPPCIEKEAKAEPSVPPVPLCTVGTSTCRRPSHVNMPGVPPEQPCTDAEAGIRPSQADMPSVPPRPLCTEGNANFTDPTCSLEQKTHLQNDHHLTPCIPEVPDQQQPHPEQQCKQPKPSQASHQNALFPGMLATPGNHNASGSYQPATCLMGIPTKPEEHQAGGVPTRQNSSHQDNNNANIAGHVDYQSQAAREQAPNSQWTKEHQASNHDQPEDLAKQHDAVRSATPGMLATPGNNNASSAAEETGFQAPTISQQGGVMGFETKKRSKQMTDKEIQHAKKPRHEVRPDDTHHSSIATGTHPEAADVTSTSETASTKRAEEPQPKIKVWTIHENEKAPQETWVQQGTTAGQITQAEANLGVMTQPIAVRSWVNSPLPLYDQVIDKQVIKLCQDLDMPRCPFVAGICTVPKIDFPCPRIHALWAQQAFVALDEMDFYLQVAARDLHVAAFPAKFFPTEASIETESHFWLGAPIAAMDQDTTWVSAAIVNHHWIPVVMTKQHTTIHVITTPEGSILLEQIEQEVHEEGLTFEVSQKILPQHFAADCGFQSFAWIMARLSQDSNEALTADQAVGWRYLFAASLLRENQHVQIIQSLPLGGTKQDHDLAKEISQLLAEHGVMLDRVQERTAMIMERIPTGTLKAVIASNKPWADLKHAANQTKPVTKLIMQDELALQIASRTNYRKHYGKKPERQQRRGESKKENPPVPAKELQVPHGVFKQQDGQILGPIGVDQVGPNAKGVVIIDQNEADAILRIPKPVTQHGLAVIVLASQVNATHHEIEVTRFPAVCTSTQEPLIAAGYIYQLGAQHVHRHEPETKIAVDEQNTEVFRCLVFHDQASKLWEDLQTHPVKTIFASEPMLRVREGQDSPIVDVWDRQWLSKRFEKVKAHNADIFAFNFRLITEDPDALITKSGTNGVYFEPRSACGRFPNNNYHVTWLQNATFHDAKYAQQTSPQSTSLARHGERYGLRSDNMNAQEIHTKHRPDVPLLLGQTKKLYTVGPLPYSTTKSAIHKLLKAWKWEGRPLQPKGRSQDGTGINWIVQATEEPSHWVFTLQHGDVLVTKLKEDKPIEAPAAYSIVASRKTLQHLQANAENVDPWLAYDPWKPTTPVKTSGQQTVQSLSTTQIAAMETNIEKKVMNAIAAKANNHDQDVNMDSTALEARVQQIESQLQHVQNVQSGVEAKVNHVELQIQQVQVSQHAVEANIGQMQQKLDQQSHHIGKTLDSKLAEHMDRIEALLCKRGRHE